MVGRAHPCALLAEKNSEMSLGVTVAIAPPRAVNQLKNGWRVRYRWMVVASLNPRSSRKWMRNSSS